MTRARSRGGDLPSALEAEREKGAWCPACDTRRPRPILCAVCWTRVSEDLCRSLFTAWENRLELDEQGGVCLSEAYRSVLAQVIAAARAPA